MNLPKYCQIFSEMPIKVLGFGGGKTAISKDLAKCVGTLLTLSEILFNRKV